MRTSRGRDARGRVERMERTGSGEQERGEDAVQKSEQSEPAALPPAQEQGRAPGAAATPRAPS
ncbi:DUF445 domain-containing protein, partial [Streptomyces griseus]|nr:DUF445 domain-containing protein [Streptomyces griseus]